MQRDNNWHVWIKENRDIAIEVFRIYVGIALMIKGFQFLIDPKTVSEYMVMVNLPFLHFLTIHVVGLVHIAFGFLLTIGLLTRVAALVQVPILFGAIFFVHVQQGLFTKEQNLEFVILVLLVLLVFVVYGGGRLSIDHILNRKSRGLYR